MSPMLWSPMFETGVKEIDDQHRRLVGYVNELQSTRANGDPALVKEVLEAAIDYTLYHFAFEECVLESSDYALTDAHKKVHEKFAADLFAMKAQLERGEIGARELNEVLTKWLFDHIRHADTAALRKPNR